MSPVLSHAANLLPTAEILAFDPAGKLASGPRLLPDRSVDFDYELRSLIDGSCRELKADPLAERPLPVVRLVVNSTAVFLLVLFLGLTMASTVPYLLGYQPVLVVSGSMEPLVRTSDIVITAESDGHNLSPGTVINFETPTGNVMHRIDSVTADGYRTAGDNNRGVDSDIVTPEQVRGVGVLIVPVVGMASLWLTQGAYLKVLALLGVLSVAVYFSRQRWVYADDELALR